MTFVITVKTKGRTPIAVMDQVNDISNARDFCHNLATLSDCENVALYDMNSGGLLTLIEWWTHELALTETAEALAKVADKPAVEPVELRKREDTPTDTPESSQDDSAGHETYTGYCVKCRTKRDFDGHIEMVKGRRMAKGNCPVCDTKMNRILPNVKVES